MLSVFPLDVSVADFFKFWIGESGSFRQPAKPGNDGHINSVRSGVADYEAYFSRTLAHAPESNPSPGKIAEI